MESGESRHLEQEPVEQNESEVLPGEGSPAMDGLIERFNRTLKMMLRKHASKFGPQWDKYLHSVLWAYRNTLHKATLEKPSFLMYG